MTHGEQAERRKAIADAVAQGDNVDDVMRRFNVSDTTVYFACKEHGVLWSKHHGEAYKRRKQIAEAAADSPGMAELCRQFKVSVNLVYRACREHGRPLPPKPPKPPKQSKERRYKSHPFDVLAKLKSPDKTTDVQVAEECGLSRERVRQIKVRAQQCGLL